MGCAQSGVILPKIIQHRGDPSVLHSKPWSTQCQPVGENIFHESIVDNLVYLWVKVVYTSDSLQNVDYGNTGLRVVSIVGREACTGTRSDSPTSHHTLSKYLPRRLLHVIFILAHTMYYVVDYVDGSLRQCRWKDVSDTERRSGRIYGQAV